MKFILCTGDSHTCGQYADGIGQFGWLSRSVGYNTAGKGFHPIEPCARDYVNLVRHYVTDHTDSKVEYMDISSWGQDWAHFRRLERPIRIDGGCDALILRVAERKEKAVLGVYLDGRLHRKKELHAELTRFGPWSITFLMIPCTGVKEITLVAEEGNVFVANCERWTGEYAVVNCGVGSCSSERYKNECLPVLLEEFPNRIFLAEVHTINDWDQRRTTVEYRESLRELLRIMADNAETVMAITVPPSLWEEPLSTKIDFYQNYINTAYEVIEASGLPMIDAHKAFADRIRGKTLDQIVGTLYGDKLHPAQSGYTLYAELIIDKLKGVL